MAVAGIAVLGPLTVNGDSDGAASLTPRDRVVLSALALRPGQVLSVERLADALWGEHPPASWKRVIPGCVMRLRRVLGTAAIETTPHGYRLVIPGENVDAQRFERLVGRGRELIAIGEPERAAHVLGEALALWRGQALADVAEWEPGRVETARLEELRRHAEEARVDAGLRCGRPGEVLGEAEALVAEAPLRERRWALLATAQYRAGRQGEALRTLRRARAVLASELGLDPGPELAAMEQAVLRQDPALTTTEVCVEPSPTCPYRGLVPFDVGDAEGFFGRDAEVADCVDRLASTGSLVVVGPSGCGKSSLVRAGVAAALQRAGRQVIVVTPGAHPLDAVEWLPDGGNVVLVVDQCEEALSSCDDDSERVRFFATLAERSDRSPLVVAVRADRLGDLSAYPGFAGIVERGLYPLRAMNESNLRLAIEGPAHDAGLLLQPGLVDLLVREVEGEPGALPLLSHSLRRTWERREGRTLTVAGYRETGGVRDAVAQSAEDVYQRLPADQRPLLHDLLLRLVVPGPDGEPIRARVPSRTLVTDDARRRLLDELLAARLLTSDDGVVEVAHEALTRAWPRLRDWLDDDVEGQRILAHLASTADAWDRLGRPDSELYRGLRLTQASEWRRRARPSLNHVEDAFLEAGEALAATELHRAEAETERQLRVNRRLRGLLAGVGMLLVAALAAGVLAWRQAERADRAADAADARRVANLAGDADDPGRALLLAIEAVRLDSTPDTRASLLDALAGNPTLIAADRTTGPLRVVDVGPDGDVVAGGPAGAWVYTADLDRVASFHLPVFTAEFRPGGDQVAISITDSFDPSPIRLVDPAFADADVQLGGLPGLPLSVYDLGHSEDGRYLAASLADNPSGAPTTVEVWDLRQPEQPIARIDGGLVWAVAVSPEGGRLYVMWSPYDPQVDTGEGNPTVSMYDVATGRHAARHELSVELTNALNSTVGTSGGSMEISPDGTLLAVADVGEIRVLDAVTLDVRDTLHIDSEAASSLQFSTDGSILAAGFGDGVVRFWPVTTGLAPVELDTGASAVQALAFSPDDRVLYTASDGLLAWDVHGARRFVARAAEPPPGEQLTRRVVPAPEGVAVGYVDVSGRGHDTVQFRDVDSAILGEPFDVGELTSNLSWRPPGWQHVAAADESGRVAVRDWRTGELVLSRRVASDVIGALAYSPDGDRLLAGERTGGLQQLDADTLEPVAQPIALGADIHQIVPTPDGRRAFVLLEADTLANVDLAQRRVVDRFELDVDPSWLAVSPDGSRLAVGAATGEVGLFDVRTGRWTRQPTANHSGWVQRVAYSTDGDTFASSGNDGQVSVWDGRTGELLGTVTPGELGTWAAAEYLPDGHTLAVATGDGAVFEWDTRIEQWIDFACAAAGTNLTEAEWQDVFPDRDYRPTCPNHERAEET
jgi:WD40 repeat protein/DNA-binding SARP family transcriptional activator